MNVEHHDNLKHYWIVNLEDTDEEWPVQKKQYGGRQEFKPVRLSFRAESRDGGHLKVSVMTISGPRLIKSGYDGAHIGQDYWNIKDLPEWALKLVEGFMAQV
jgi:hypothetical protein